MVIVFIVALLYHLLVGMSAMSDWMDDATTAPLASSRAVLAWADSSSFVPRIAPAWPICTPDGALWPAM